MMRRKCFVNAHCCIDCPNFESQIADERYGYGIAEDMGLEEIKCKDCHCDSGECKDCLLKHSSDCPEYGREDK